MSVAHYYLPYDYRPKKQGTHRHGNHQENSKKKPQRIYRHQRRAHPARFPAPHFLVGDAYMVKKPYLKTKKLIL